MYKILMLCLSLSLFVSCASGPKPWEKRNLARKQMRLGGADVLQMQVNEHVFSSKEGSFGGSGVAMGGCGCN